MGRWYIGIDIGGTNLRFALVDKEGAVISRRRTSSGIEGGLDEFCGRLLAGVDEMRSVAASAGREVAGIGAGIPGLIGIDGLIHSSVNMRPLDGFNVVDFLEARTGLPSACGNDANVIALGEHAFGAGRPYSSFMMLTIGTGLGSGLILDGRLWKGANGFAAEFGHVTMEQEGIPCPCGNRGCLERYVSAGAIVRFARELVPLELIIRPEGVLDAGGIAGLARKGEAGALAAFERVGHWLGIGVASLVNTLNLEAVIIGGGVAASFDLLLPAVAAELQRRCFLEQVTPCRIVKAELGDDAGLLGGGRIGIVTVKGRRGPRPGSVRDCLQIVFCCYYVRIFRIFCFGCIQLYGRMNLT